MNFLRTEGAFTGIVLLLAVTIFSAGFVIGCTKKPGSSSTPTIGLAGGATDAFDSYAFTTLVEYKAAIDQSKIEYANGNLPIGAKGILNQAIGAYDQAEGFWQRYHSSGGTSADATALEGEITADLAQLAAYVVQLKAMGAAKAVTPKTNTPALTSPTPAAKTPGK